MVDFVYPPICAGCGSTSGLFCDECRSKVNPIKDPICQICGKPIATKGICSDCVNNPPPYQMLRSWGEFNGPLREALHRLKYKNDIALGATFAKPLIELANNNDWDFDIVIPIPISKRHKKDRGYNQAALIAFPIALAFKKPFTQSAVLRIKETKSQVKLSSVERFKNLQNAFQGNSAKLKDKKVLLVDDVTTTGATIDSCAQTLIESGCKKVYCLTVAQTPKIYQKTL